MVDICLELDADLISRLTVQAKMRGTTVDLYIRDMIVRNAPALASVPEPDGSLYDKPIVKAAEIENAARDLGHGIGWRFMTCPQNNMASAKLLLVTLNPAGRAIHGPAWSQESGSAYLVESWGGNPAGRTKLQRQVRALFDLLGLQEKEVFSAHYVPFRSPTWNDLPRKRETLAFAENLWKWLKPQLNFDRIVCIGKVEPGRSIARLYDATLEASLPVGWGDVTADRYRLPDGRSLIALPHLSRFMIFGRPEGESALAAIFEQ